MNIDEINREIYILEKGQTTYANCEKLSQLYIIRDHLGCADDVQSREAVPMLEGSEFLSISSGVNIADLLNILDEHFEIIAMTYPKEYDVIIQKISALK